MTCILFALHNGLFLGATSEIGLLFGRSPTQSVSLWGLFPESANTGHKVPLLSAYVQWNIKEAMSRHFLCFGPSQSLTLRTVSVRCVCAAYLGNHSSKRRRLGRHLSVSHFTLGDRVTWSVVRFWNWSWALGGVISDAARIERELLAPAHLGSPRRWLPAVR